MEKTSTDSNGRIAIPNDLIRTLAIALVILLHAASEALQVSQTASANWWTGVVYKSLSLSSVPLFIMVSGALLLQPAKLNEPIRVFLKKRLSRIGLAFAFWSGVYLAWGFYISKTPVTLGNVYQGIIKGLFTGSWYQFWFIYLIVGLYLITPILRVIIAYGSDRIVRYLILLWFVGVAIVPILQLAADYTLNPWTFLIGGWIGYFVLGTYLQKIKVRTTILAGLVLVCLFWTIFGAWLMNLPLAGLQQQDFFFDSLTVNIIVGSAALFMILIKFRPDWPGSNPTVGKRFVKTISRNTLPIFLFHVLILESFERGYFGFTLSALTLNPIVEIPLIAALTFFVTLGLVFLMRKVPVLKKLIG